MANFNYNKVIIGGRLTADPELKTTQSGISVVSFSVAVNRKHKGEGQAETDFFNVTAWRQTAEFVSRYFKKGSSICITGSIQNSTWTDRQNVKHIRTDIVADEITFVDSRDENASPAPPSYGAPSAVQPKFEEIKTDDDLPF